MHVWVVFSNDELECVCTSQEIAYKYAETLLLKESVFNAHRTHYEFTRSPEDQSGYWYNEKKEHYVRVYPMLVLDS